MSVAESLEEGSESLPACPFFGYDQRRGSIVYASILVLLVSFTPYSGRDYYEAVEHGVKVLVVWGV